MVDPASEWLPAWFGTGWLITMTVLWVIVSLYVALWYLAMMNDPAGMSRPYSLTAGAAGTGAILVVYIAPLCLGWAAYALETTLWACLLYLVPHVLTAAILIVLYLRSRVRRSTGG